MGPSAYPFEYSCSERCLILWPTTFGSTRSDTAWTNATAAACQRRVPIPRLVWRSSAAWQPWDLESRGGSSFRGLFPATSALTGSSEVTVFRAVSDLGEELRWLCSSMREWVVVKSCSRQYRSCPQTRSCRHLDPHCFCCCKSASNSTHSVQTLKFWHYYAWYSNLIYYSKS